jgi:hypothetical protein
MDDSIDDLAGIPGTFLDDAARRLRWLADGEIPVPGGTGRRYRTPVADGVLWAVVSRDLVPVGTKARKLWHVSVSHRADAGRQARYPSWDELRSAVYRLVQEDVCWILIFPRRSQGPQGKYVNLMETCLHLWQSTGELDL